MSDRAHEFTIPYTLVDFDTRILTVVAFQDGTYSISIAKKHGTISPKSDLSERIVTNSSSWIILTETELAVHLAYDLFDEHHWHKL
jgi:hypothetical protein